MSSTPVPLKTRRVRQRCTLNLSGAQTSSRWCGVVASRGGASSGVVHVTSPWFKITWSVAKSPRVAEQCDVNIYSLTHAIPGNTKKYGNLTISLEPGRGILRILGGKELPAQYMS
ncbi:uncharacterized protein TNCV_3676101 [Trichonephila clavipes]|nr:uncharacterized protein TNCV_3676101 [Trichonephila clavipes]